MSNVPFKSPIAKAFVEAGSQIGLPVIDVNGEKQIGINYLQVIWTQCGIRVHYNFANTFKLNPNIAKFHFYSLLLSNILMKQ